MARRQTLREAEAAPAHEFPGRTGEERADVRLQAKLRANAALRDRRPANPHSRQVLRRRALKGR